jgi:hypothetical protein
MSDLAHAILSLSNCVASNVEQFEKIIEKIRNQNSSGNNTERLEKIDLRTYVVSIL